jgi:hypothetical protein
MMPTLSVLQIIQNNKSINKFWYVTIQTSSQCKKEDEHAEKNEFTNSPSKTIKDCQVIKQPQNKKRWVKTVESSSHLYWYPFYQNFIIQIKSRTAAKKRDSTGSSQ